METWKPRKGFAGDSFNKAASAREVEMNVPGAAFLPFGFVSACEERKKEEKLGDIGIELEVLVFFGEVVVFVGVAMGGWRKMDSTLRR